MVELSNLSRAQYEHLDSQVTPVVRRAGEKIIDIYHASGTVQVETKADESPVTRADLEANQVLVQGLAQCTPEMPLLTEESGLPPFSERERWSAYWLIDPLDGTKEFISRNGDFTVNVALIVGHAPFAGWVLQPTSGTMYTGFHGQKERGAWKLQGASRTPIRTRPLPQNGALTVVASRRHGSEAQQRLMKVVKSQFPDLQARNVGSSLKICMVAEGLADWYPRLAPTSEWDTAAADAVLRGAGGMTMDTEFKPLSYNAKESILNPFFHVIGDPTAPWQKIFRS